MSFALLVNFALGLFLNFGPPRWIMFVYETLTVHELFMRFLCAVV